jgi:hypothetical protein
MNKMMMTTVAATTTVIIPLHITISQLQAITISFGNN